MTGELCVLAAKVVKDGFFLSGKCSDRDDTLKTHSKKTLVVFSFAYGAFKAITPYVQQ